MRQVKWTHTITVREVRDGGEQWSREECRLLKNEIVTALFGRFSRKTGYQRGQIGAAMMGRGKMAKLDTLREKVDDADPKPSDTGLAAQLIEEQAKKLALIVIGTKKNLYDQAEEIGITNLDDDGFIKVERAGGMFQCEGCGYFLRMERQSHLNEFCKPCAAALNELDKDPE